MYMYSWAFMDMNIDSNECFCFLGDLPEPPFPSPPFPGSKVVHRRKKRQVWLLCRNICWKIILISRGMLVDFLLYDVHMSVFVCVRGR